MVKAQTLGRHTRIALRNSWRTAANLEALRGVREANTTSKYSARRYYGRLDPRSEWPAMHVALQLSKLSEQLTHPNAAVGIVRHPDTDGVETRMQHVSAMRRTRPKCTVSFADFCCVRDV